MKRYFILLIILVISLNAKDLVSQKGLIEGKLANGLKYTIKKNKKPKNMASFRLVVKIGSLEEDEDQRGIAHLVEHMAFNGTKHFKNNSLVEFLESLGVGFGSHLNASTSWNRTMYQLQVPLQGDNLEKSMLVFADWAGGLDMTQKELDKERGVVLEEKRVRNDSGYRVFKQIFSSIYDGTRYKVRFPIGKEKVIKNISLNRVKDFYNTWYQPRFMNFVAVGDFDVKEVEKLIQKNFANLKNSNKNDRYPRSAIETNSTKFEIYRDKELSNMSINFSFVSPYTKIKTEKDYKDEFIVNITRDMFNLKAKELMLQKNPPAKNIGFSQYNIGDNLYYNSFGAGFVKTDGLKAFRQMLKLIYTVDKNGFSKSDFGVVKKDILARNSDILKKIENKTSNDWASEIAYHKTNDEIIVDIDYAVKLEEKLLKEITLKDINSAYREILKSKTRLIYFVVPDDYQISIDDIKKIYSARENNISSSDRKSKLPKDIKTKELKPAKIILQNYNKKDDYYEFVLDNGVKVVYKYNGYEKNKVQLKAFSKGGFSIYDTKILPSAKNSASIVDKSGIGKFNSLEVQKIYSDKIFNLSSEIDRYYEKLNGSSSAKDFKYLLKDVYLLAYMYKVDENILANSKAQMVERIQKEKNVPQQIFFRKFIEFYHNKSKRYTMIDTDDVKSINKSDILKIYKDRFSDFNNFTFIIVGDIKKSELIKYAKLYLGNLPSKKRDETFIDRENSYIKGKHEFVKYLNNEDISSVMFVYKKNLPFSVKKRLDIIALQDILNVKLREYIREEKSGVYGVSARIYFDRTPKDEVNVRVYFSCKPDRAKELAGYVKKIIKQMKNKTVEQKYLDSFVKKQLVKIDENTQKNKFHMQQLQKHYMYNGQIIAPSRYKELFSQISPKDVMQIANEVFSTNNVVYAELSPKKNKPKDTKK